MHKAWNALKTHKAKMGGRTIVELFADDETRAQDFAVRAQDMLFDYSKTTIDPACRALLLDLARTANVAQKRDAMFRGEAINETEGRAVLHTALRKMDAPIFVGGKDVTPALRETHERLSRFAEDVRSGRFKGQGGRITDVVNIGIGGSDLGPAMAYLALAPYVDGPRCHFISNVDSAHAADILRGLDPETTLVIVASKTFTTIETMTNAQTVRAWMETRVKDSAAQFAAVSSAPDKTGAFGIAPERVFGFEDWVGGRYSIWGPIGLSLMIAIGHARFDAFLRGAADMDAHFISADFEQNMPVILALVGIWHNQICGYASRAVLPYEQRLSRLPAYLQQLEMESNGKSAAMDGSALDYGSGPIVWGEPGTNGQHAFYQLIHQGTQNVPCEFLIAKTGHESDRPQHHLLLIANCLAQSEALMEGRSLEAARALMAAQGLSGAEAERQARHRVFAGNRPSTTLAYPQLTPYRLGNIIALYEHRVFVEGVILGINSFDQWGVELGKELAVELLPILEKTQSAAGKDASTRQLIAWLG